MLQPSKHYFQDTYMYCTFTGVFLFLEKLLRGGGGKIEIAVGEGGGGGHTCVSVYACKCLHYDRAK